MKREMYMTNIKHVVIVGGGASGMLCAILAAQQGLGVTLLEHNEKFGKKLYITGKGRCNFTNDCSPEEFLDNVVRNPKFLFSASRKLTSRDVMELFEAFGMAVKVERGRRAFPASDHSSDVIDALVRRMKKLHVDLQLHTDVKRILTSPVSTEPDPKAMTATSADGKPDPKAMTASPADGKPDPKAVTATSADGKPDPKAVTAASAGGKRLAACGVEAVHQDGSTVRIEADAVVLATGGLSYPSTGSTGDGYTFAKSLGLSVTATSPSLVPVNCAEEYIRSLQGLSLKNVRLCVRSGKKTLFDEFGELLFTHFGISGPLVLSLSAVIGPYIGKKELRSFIDLKPAVTEEQLHARISRLCSEHPKKALKNILGELYPAKMVPVIPSLAGVPEEIRCCDLTKEQREALVRVTKEFPLTLTSLRGFNEAVITRGGVSVKDINPKTMEAKNCRNLYVIGELLDVDAFTGGYNLQIAWCTAASCAAALAGTDTGAGKD